MNTICVMILRKIEINYHISVIFHRSYFWQKHREPTDNHCWNKNRIIEWSTESRNWLFVITVLTKRTVSIFCNFITGQKTIIVDHSAIQEDQASIIGELHHWISFIRAWMYQYYQWLTYNYAKWNVGLCREDIMKGIMLSHGHQV